MSEETRAPEFEKGVNPRHALPNHRERGAKRFEYTLKDVADLFGVSKRTVHRWQAEGLDPSNLEDICEHYHQRMLEARERG